MKNYFSKCSNLAPFIKGNIFNGVVIKFSHIKFLLAALSLVLFNACNPTKKLKDGEYLLNKNIVINKGTTIGKADIENYIKLKPNRKILEAFRFRLWLHNQVNEDKVKEKRIAYDKEMEEKNEKRLAQGKKARSSDHKLFGEWLLSVGEPPVIYDSILVQKSAQQLKLLVNNKGYFISSVSDSVHYKKSKKVDVYYIINASAPYTINKIDYKIQDESLKRYVFADTVKALLKKGNNFDVDMIQGERDHITGSLTNNGYYLFNKDYIYFEIDTNIGNRKVNITVGIKNYEKKFNNLSDSIVEIPHQRFKINNVYIQPDFVAINVNHVKTDTLIVGDYYIIHSEKLKYKPNILLNAVFIHKGDIYQSKNMDATYKRLAELRTLKSINIYFTQNDDETLDCHIQMNSTFKQAFTAETDGTNTSGYLGISGSLLYQNRNLFKGSELLEIRLKGALSAQPNIGSTNTTNITSNAAFNTIEFGPEVNLKVPRFMVPFNINTSKLLIPRTIFTSGLSYQNRPDYTRTITNFSLGYTWSTTPKKRHTFNPFVINFVKVGLTNAFNDTLQKQHNEFIINSFSNHVSTSTRYSFTYNDQNLKTTKNFWYFKINLEASGNLLRGAYNVINSVQPNTFAKDTKDQEGYMILKIPYTQYLRMDVDYRYYLNMGSLGKFVFRFAGGIGKPLANYNVLPYERSFFSGGANGIRAWQANTLGPGSFSEKTISYDQFGDSQLEANIEHRFKIYKMINGATFIDAGNVWLIKTKADTSLQYREGGLFNINQFYKQIAIGTGVGLRADFNFFVVRLDMGIKVRDPEFADDERWVIQRLFNPSWFVNNASTVVNSDGKYGSKYSFLTYNIAIGYPF